MKTNPVGVFIFLIGVVLEMIVSESLYDYFHLSCDSSGKLDLSRYENGPDDEISIKYEQRACIPNRRFGSEVQSVGFTNSSSVFHLKNVSWNIDVIQNEDEYVFMDISFWFKFEGSDEIETDYPILELSWKDELQRDDLPRDRVWLGMSTCGGELNSHHLTIRAEGPNILSEYPACDIPINGRSSVKEKRRLEPGTWHFIVLDLQFSSGFFSPVPVFGVDNDCCFIDGERTAVDYNHLDHSDVLWGYFLSTRYPNVLDVSIGGDLDGNHFEGMLKDFKIDNWHAFYEDKDCLLSWEGENEIEEMYESTLIDPGYGLLTNMSFDNSTSLCETSQYCSIVDNRFGECCALSTLHKGHWEETSTVVPIDHAFFGPQTTFSFWIHFENWPVDDYIDDIQSFKFTYGNESHYTFFVEITRDWYRTSSNREIRVGLYTNEGSLPIDLVASPERDSHFTTLKWSNIVIVIDGDFAELYLNGKWHAEVNGLSSKGLRTGAGLLTMGVLKYTSYEVEVHMDDVAVYSRALSSFEVSKMFTEFCSMDAVCMELETDPSDNDNDNDDPVVDDDSTDDDDDDDDDEQWVVSGWPRFPTSWTIVLSCMVTLLCVPMAGLSVFILCLPLIRKLKKGGYDRYCFSCPKTLRYWLWPRLRRIEELRQSMSQADSILDQDEDSTQEEEGAANVTNAANQRNSTQVSANRDDGKRRSATAGASKEKNRKKKKRPKVENSVKAEKPVQNTGADKELKELDEGILNYLKVEKGNDKVKPATDESPSRSEPNTPPESGNGPEVLSEERSVQYNSQEAGNGPEVVSEEGGSVENRNSQEPFFYPTDPIVHGEGELMGPSENGTSPVLASVRMESEIGLRSEQLVYNCEVMPEQSVRQKGFCVVCMVKESDTAFYKCGHKVCCGGCAKKLLKKKKTCPICRKKIRKILKIFN